MSDLFKRASSEKITDYLLFLQKDKLRFLEFYKKKIRFKETLDDFIRMQTLGAGSFGRVVLIKHKSTEKYFAMKVLNKEKIVELEQVQHTYNEKNILQALNFPFLIHMFFYFQDNSNIYFVLPFIMGGEMFHLLMKMKHFEEDHARFYAAQVCLGLDYLHYLDLVFRDLKPENILIEDNGYLKLTDFGFCKLINGRTYTLCGTPEYLAPELILSRGYGFSVDWWSYGILIYEMNAGYSPFYHKDPIVLYDKIVSGQYKFPQSFSANLRDLLKNLIQLDLSKRFGNLRNGSDDIREHKWFKQINWTNLLNKDIVPPFVPEIKSVKDASKNFHKYPDEPIKVSLVDRYAREFSNF